ncbi:MAG: hypothetical protein HC933_14160 [Pleurocapsa sp. SU_196_0]|nr:hypothetical protein [Pleurocapsa sp. SU_196_0]
MDHSFRDLKLIAAGHGIIKADSALFSITREYFKSAHISPNQQKIAVISQISDRDFNSGGIKISIFNLKTQERIWKHDLGHGDSSRFSRVIWDTDNSRILVYNLPGKPRIFDSLSGIEVQNSLNISPCVFVLDGKKLSNLFYFSLCSENTEVTLISKTNFSILWRGSFNNADSQMKKLSDRQLNDIFDNKSPDSRFSIEFGNRFLKISDLSKRNQSWHITSHWSVSGIIWSENSKLIAVGGDDYFFNGFDGETVYPIKNMLLLKWDGNKFLKRRLHTYGEDPTTVGFIDKSQKLVALTDTSIIIWKL